MKRRSKGTPEGGQFAPDTSGSTQIPCASDINALPDAGSANLDNYAHNLGKAYDIYAEQMKERSARLSTCAYCLKPVTEGSDHDLCYPDGFGYEQISANNTWAEEKVVIAYKTSADGEVKEYKESVFLPSRKEIRETLKKGKGLKFSVEATLVGPDENGLINSTTFKDKNLQYARGSVTLITRDNDDPIIDTRRMKCDCLQYRSYYHCSHIDMITRGIQQRCEGALTAVLTRRKKSETAAREAALLVASSLVRAKENDWTRDPIKAAEAARMWRADSDVLYSGDADAFYDDMIAAKNRSRNGEPALPYEKDYVLDGLCQRGSGQAFGIEIEYDFPQSLHANSSLYRETQRKIAQDLYAAGIIRTPKQEIYGSAGSRGFVDTHVDFHGEGTWVFEDDGSVCGEIVSPGMYDEPETWEKLATVMRILKENGAIPSAHAGAHVHVGTASYGDNPAPYAELTRLVTQHEDVLARLSSDPVRGTHRNNGYSAPLPPTPPSGFEDLYSAANLQYKGSGRSSFLNLDSVSHKSPHGNHVEFRSFDSTLDETVMQAQIKLAVGMVAAAQRNAEAGGTTRGKEPWGSHMNINAIANPVTSVMDSYISKGQKTREEIAQESTTTRSFLDTVFRRRSDKAVGAALFGFTSWSTPKLSRALYRFD